MLYIYVVYIMCIYICTYYSIVYIGSCRSSILSCTSPTAPSSVQRGRHRGHCGQGLLWQLSGSAEDLGGRRALALEAIRAQDLGIL